MSLTDRIPGQGLLLAEGREKLAFVPYVYREGKIWVEEQDQSGFLDWDKCIFFNRDTEYRRIRRGARGDVIETVLTAEEEEKMPPDLLYTEEVLVKPQYTAREGIPEKLRIVNRYRYSENDTLVLEDYRVAMI